MKAFFTAMMIITGLFLPCLAAEAYQYEYEEDVKLNAKLSIGGYIQGKAIYAFDHDTPDEHPSGEIGLEMKANASSWLSAKLILKAVQDGKVKDPADDKFFNQFNLIYQNNHSYIDINEAFLTSIPERLISGWGFKNLPGAGSMN